jgi:hypothetical protein
VETQSRLSAARASDEPTKEALTILAPLTTSSLGWPPAAGKPTLRFRSRYFKSAPSQPFPLKRPVEKGVFLVYVARTGLSFKPWTLTHKYWAAGGHSESCFYYSYSHSHPSGLNSCFCTCMYKYNASCLSISCQLHVYGSTVAYLCLQLSFLDRLLQQMTNTYVHVVGNHYLHFKLSVLMGSLYLGQTGKGLHHQKAIGERTSLILGE